MPSPPSPDKARRGKHPARRGRSTPPARAPVNPRDALFDQERLAKQTYLTIPELCAYGRFPTENATYVFLSRNIHRIPKCRRGRTVTILRRDYDRAVQPNTREKSGRG